MYIEVTKGMFRDAFKQSGRSDNFSYEGLGELYDYLEATNEDWELDVIALCCEYAEGDLYEVLKDYNLEDIEELESKTQVVWHDHATARVLYLQF